MRKFYRPVSFLLWILGLIAMVVAVVWRIVPHQHINLNVAMSSVLLLAAVFYLGAIATRAIEQAAAD
jgi:hypothetical protein